MNNKEIELVTKEFVEKENTYNLAVGGGNPSAQNTITARDDNNNKFKVFNDDPRWLSGELVGNTKGFVLARHTITNKIKLVDLETFNNCDLFVGVNKGYTHTQETKNKMKEKRKYRVETKEVAEKRSKSLMGHNVTEETKDKLRKFKGRNHHSWCGYIVTPEGIFESISDAVEYINGITEYQLKRYLNNTNKITQRDINNSGYLRDHHKNSTFQELGFYKESFI